MISHAHALAKLTGKQKQPRAKGTRKARKRRGAGVGSSPQFVVRECGDAGFTARIKLVSANVTFREHWRISRRRAKEQKAECERCLLYCVHPDYLPGLVVTITRIGPRTLDSDNLAISAKHVRDSVARWLGIDDRDPRVEWKYEQERAEEPRTYGVRVEWSERT